MKTKKFTCILVLCVNILLFQSCNDSEFEENLDEDIVTAITEIEVTDTTTSLIVAWSNLWVSLDQYTVGMRPNIVTRSLAYIHLTGYETAIPYMDNYISNTRRINNLNINTNVFESNVNLDLALNTAYAVAIDHFMYELEAGIRQNISDFESSKKEELIIGLSESEIENSENWGRYVAQRVITYSETDRDAEQQIVNQTPSDYEAPVGVGLWTAGENENAWFPYWREVRTFAITPEQSSSTNFNSVLQYSTNSNSTYYQQMFDVYEATTNAATTNSEDLWIAEFWADDVEGLMISPPGRHFSIANQLIAQNDLDYDETLELLLRLGFAMNDAAVSAWDDKYTYNIERPSNYITAYINDDFTTNLSKFISGVNPAFPSYPSGHATFAGVAAGVFIDFFNTDNIDFTDNTYSGYTNLQFNGTPRSFTSFTEMALENAYSRVPLGVHIEQDAIEGLRLGYEVSNAINNLNLTRNN
ncbi:vanadium-dependent haloperoxidase [Polaribacter sargassicola]|uniref:vanadium-dependent haloperoxidase n=1 Tax=Polaribacter sargassicola TaxID=2836891 RepID=UPI001F1AD53F|nr:vanadium-dependent haloperoxidase [Polaribacter sp. DS7-9]MCG1036824.1 vanadium-dependent haloperoxidase [Polaribacter sp. DS7-9]